MERKFKLRNGTIVVLDQSKYGRGGVRVVESVGVAGWEKDAHGCLLLGDDCSGIDCEINPLTMTGGAWGSALDVVAEVTE